MKLAILLMVLAVNSKADQGAVAANRIERGQTSSVRQVSVSSTTGTALWTASVKRPDGVCRNNSAFTVWLGTVNYSAFGYTHPNIAFGFPVLSSETFKLDGSFQGEIDATSDSAGTLDIRCLDGLVP